MPPSEWSCFSATASGGSTSPPTTTTAFRFLTPRRGCAATSTGPRPAGPHRELRPRLAHGRPSSATLSGACEVARQRGIKINLLYSPPTVRTPTSVPIAGIRCRRSAQKLTGESPQAQPVAPRGRSHRPDPRRKSSDDGTAPRAALRVADQLRPIDQVCLDMWLARRLAATARDMKHLAAHFIPTRCSAPASSATTRLLHPRASCPLRKRTHDAMMVSYRWPASSPSNPTPRNTGRDGFVRHLADSRARRQLHVSHRPRCDRTFHPKAVAAIEKRGRGLRVNASHLRHAPRAGELCAKATTFASRAPDDRHLYALCLNGPASA